MIDQNAVTRRTSLAAGAQTQHLALLSGGVHALVRDGQTVPQQRCSVGLRHYLAGCSIDHQPLAVGTSQVQTLRRHDQRVDRG